MKLAYSDYEIDDDRTRLDFDRVHGWLSQTYWSPGIARDQVETAARRSLLVVGAYSDDRQAGYLRIVSDSVRIAYLCDVYVDKAHRKRGLAKAMLSFALQHPDLQDVKRWLLATADAHDVYRAVGFEPLPNPERWMALTPDTR